MEWYKFSEKTPDRFDTILISNGREVLAAGFSKWDLLKIGEFQAILTLPNFIGTEWTNTAWLESDGDINIETFPYWAKWPEPPAENI